MNYVKTGDFHVNDNKYKADEEEGDQNRSIDNDDDSVVEKDDDEEEDIYALCPVLIFPISPIKLGTPFNSLQRCSGLQYPGTALHGQMSHARTIAVRLTHAFIQVAERLRGGEEFSSESKHITAGCPLARLSHRISHYCFHGGNHPSCLNVCLVCGAAR